jgi:hypothetical protein
MRPFIKGKSARMQGEAWTDGVYCCTPARSRSAGSVTSGRTWEPDWHLFTTREAAEGYLFRAERDRQRQREEAAPELRRLGIEMADVHPDRGGTNEGSSQRGSGIRKRSRECHDAAERHDRPRLPRSW